MSFPKINLHIHSVFSDGRNTIRKIVIEALNKGLNHIAITDHFTNSWKAGVIPTLNNKEKIKYYLDEISKYQDYLGQSNKNLILYKGVEIDIESSEKFIKNFIEPDKFDIILFEYLESTQGIAFVRKIIESWKISVTIEKQHPLLGLAHFNPSFFIHGRLDELIHFLKEYNIYFEFNSRYPEYYSRQNELFFQKLRQNNIPITIGCDSHDSRHLDDINGPLEMIRFYNLENNFNIFFDILEKRKNR